MLIKKYIKINPKINHTCVNVKNRTRKIRVICTCWVITSTNFPNSTKSTQKLQKWASIIKSENFIKTTSAQNENFIFEKKLCTCNKNQ